MDCFAAMGQQRLSEAIAFALPVSLLDLPEGPHRRGQQGNHHGQKTAMSNPEP
jgi:hypothetical protein